MQQTINEMTTSCFLVLLLFSAGCKKWVGAPAPAAAPDAPVLFSTETSARGVLNGVYSGMITGQVFASSGATLYGGLAADELWYYPEGTPQEFARNQITPAAHSLLSTAFWQPAYRFIYTANLALEQLPGAPIRAEVKKELTGEAYFIRAFSYGGLVHFFGGVPLVLRSDYRQSMHLPRASKEQVYARILVDLQQAEELLPEADDPALRYRPTRAAAQALRARLLRYEGRWKEAAAAAGKVIGSGRFSLAPLPEEVFLAGSPELIFFLEPPPPYFSIPEAAAVLPRSAATLPTYCLREDLLQAFEAGDRRKGAWTTRRSYGGQVLYYPAKYKSPATGAKEGYAVLRLAEQYLIRSEAFARLGDLDRAREDLNTVRRRAGLPLFTISDRDSLLAAVDRERRIELAVEWAHRWMDLRRSGKAGEVLSRLKGTTWHTTDTLWPVPADQIRLNGALIQNPGY